MPTTPQPGPQQTQYQQPSYQQPSYRQPSSAPHPVVEAKNGAGLAGFIIAILSLYLGVFYCIAPIIGFICSIVGMARRKNCNRWNGVTVAGFVINLIVVIFWAIIWITVGAAIVSILA
ncbi:MAG: hypothetical protein LUD51_00465 [Clostridia bacterium]|nr:hypothetical protein [Clostridia bacterium]